MDIFEYNVDDSMNEIIEDRGNGVFVALRKVQWPSSDRFKVDIRKWRMSANGDERPDKGVTFNNDESLDILVHKLVRYGYGDTDTILYNMRERDDIIAECADILRNKGLPGDTTLDELYSEHCTKNDDFFDPSKELV